MKAMDHQRILRERLNALREYMLSEVAERDRVIENYADALDNQQAAIVILTDMLVEHGISRESIMDRLESMVQS